MPDALQTAAHGEEKYWAFISYSHRDRMWGEWLHKKLETFRVPKRLVGAMTARGQVPSRLFPTFRDREELPVSADLGRNIDEALRLSKYLVVICSPAAAKSRWVNEEILSFKRLGRSDRVLALIVDGEPNASDGKPGWSAEQECFPEALRFALEPDGKLGLARTEPIAADARPGQDGRENAFLKLVAGIIRVNYDDLRQREHERKLQQLRIVIAASSFLLLVFAALGIALFIQRNYAREQKNRAEKALEEVRQTLSRSDYLQAVDAHGKGASPEALAFLSRAVRTNPRHAAATELLISSLRDRSWLLPVGGPLLLGDDIGIAVFDSKGEALFVSEGMEEWRILNPWTGIIISKGKVAPARIARAAFSPDGKRIAIAFGPMEANVVQVLDVQSGRALSTAIPLKGLAVSIAFSQNGKTLLTAGGSMIEEHDAQTGVESRTPIDQGTPVMWAETTPDGSIIVSGTLFESSFWNAETRQADGLPLKHDAVPQSFAISPAGDKLAIALGDGSGRIYSMEDREPIGEALVHRSDITALRYSANGQMLLTTSNDKTSILWDASTGLRVSEPMRHEQPVVAAALTPSQDTVFTVTGGFGKPARLHKWSLNRPLAAYASLVHEDRVLSFSINRSGSRIVTGCSDGKVRVWDARTQSLIAGPIQLDGEVVACVFSPDSETIATASGSLVALWDATLAKAPSAPLNHEGAVTTVSFSPDGQHLLTASLDGTTRLWNAHDATPSAPPMKHDDGVVTAEFSPDGGRILTGSNDGAARLWNATNGEMLGEPMRHAVAVTRAHFSLNGQRVVTGSKDGVVRLWDAHSGRAATPPLTHDREVADVLFSADSRTMISAVGEFGGQGSARVWDAESGGPLTDPMLHPDGVESAALHPYGDRLFTGAFDGMLRVWDVHTGKPRSVPIRFKEPIVRVQYSPLASQLVLASGSIIALLELMDTSPTAPPWLTELAERVGGLRFNTNGLLEPTPERSVDELSRQIHAREPRDNYERFGLWFLGQPSPIHNRR